LMSDVEFYPIGPCARACSSYRTFVYCDLCDNGRLGPKNTWAQGQKAGKMLLLPIRETAVVAIVSVRPTWLGLWKRSARMRCYTTPIQTGSSWFTLMAR
jgi:hypothetical protein